MGNYLCPKCRSNYCLHVDRRLQKQMIDRYMAQGAMQATSNDLMEYVGQPLVKAFGYSELMAQRMMESYSEGLAQELPCMPANVGTSTSNQKKLLLLRREK